MTAREWGRQAWFRMWLGWTLGVGLAARWPPPPPARPPVVDLGPGHVLPGVRDWRGVNGIGARRALDLCRAAWETRGAPEPFDPRTVPGIGDELAGRVREFLGALPVDSSQVPWDVH